MNIENQARDSVTNERQNQKLRKSSLDERTQEEVRAGNQDGVAETAREHTTHQRQQEEKRQSSMQQRAHE